jgi:hypothetical protein
MPLNGRQGAPGRPQRSSRMIGVLFSQLIHLITTALPCYRETSSIARGELSNSDSDEYSQKASSISKSSRSSKSAVSGLAVNR